MSGSNGTLGTTGSSAVFDRPEWTGAIQQPAIMIDALLG
jgi:hypothetical protein